MPTTSNINRVSPETGAPLVTDRLLIANRAWLTWLQGLFKSRPIGNYKWDRNVTETEIIITDQNPSGSEPSNKRPIIATSRGAATWARGRPLPPSLTPLAPLLAPLGALCRKYVYFVHRTVINLKPEAKDLRNCVC